MELGTSYCFDDILMEPLFSAITSRSSISLHTNIATSHRSLILKTPLISSPMDTVTETQMAIKMALCGGLGIIHRYMSINEQVAQVVKVKRFLQYIIRQPYRVLPSATYTDLEMLIALYGVSTYCVVSDMASNEFLGILTKRDIEAMANSPEAPNEKRVSEYMTAFDNTSFQAVYCETYEIDDHPEKIIQLAKKKMLEHRYEKMPILAVTDISNSSGEHTTPRLLGLLTLKNIRHWENNHSRACIDSTGALCVGAAIGIIGDYLTRLEALTNAGVDLVCVDIANGYNANVYNAIIQIRKMYPNLVIMAGNVCNKSGFEYLADPALDIDCIRVGIGNGSICTTRLETGIGKGQFSAVWECFQAKTSNRLTAHIICDGGSLGKTGNKVKALAAGASVVMLGRTLASTEESPGDIIYRNGKRFKYIRGMASTMANLSKQEKIQSNTSNMDKPNKKLKLNIASEGVDGEQELTGSVQDLLEQINAGIKSGFSYLGAYNLEEIHQKRIKGHIKFNLTTSIGMSETGLRVKTY
jgi:IMP dehydrogenase